MLNYASTASIEELMKFYNLGDETFETEFTIRLNYGFLCASKRTVHGECVFKKNDYGKQ